MHCFSTGTTHTFCSCVESTLVQWLSKGIPGTNMHAGNASSYALDIACPKEHKYPGLSRGSPLPTSRPNFVKRVSSEPLPPEQPRVVILYSHIPIYLYLDFFFPCLCTLTTRINGSIIHYLSSRFVFLPSVHLINTRVNGGIIFYFYLILSTLERIAPYWCLLTGFRRSPPAASFIVFKPP